MITRTMAWAVAALCSACALPGPAGPSSASGPGNPPAVDAAAAPSSAVALVTVGSPIRQMSGRINLRIHRPSDGATDGGTLLFEFEGTADRGTLNLQTVIGTTVAQARWDRDGAEIATAQGRQSGATLDDVASHLLRGESIPLAALLHWIRAEPWSGAPHRPSGDGFEQLGWQVSLAAWHERVITAQRAARPDEPRRLEITVRARLDDPSDAQVQQSR